MILLDDDTLVLDQGYVCTPRVLDDTMTGHAMVRGYVCP